MQGSDMGTLNIYNNNVKVFSKSGNQGNQWHQASVDLSGNLDVSGLHVELKFVLLKELFKNISVNFLFFY